MGDGVTGVSSLFGGIRYGAHGLVIGGFTGGNDPYERYGVGLDDTTAPAASSGQLYDDVLTFDASTNTFTDYINGTEVGSVVRNFGTLSQASSSSGFSIGGGTNEPYNDWSDPETTSDFLFYNGALTPTEVAAVDASGVGASVSTINSDIGAVPEPSTWALVLGGASFLIAYRRRR